MKLGQTWDFDDFHQLELGWGFVRLPQWLLEIDHSATFVPDSSRRPILGGKGGFDGSYDQRKSIGATI